MCSHSTVAKKHPSPPLPAQPKILEHEVSKADARRAELLADIEDAEAAVGAQAAAVQSAMAAMQGAAKGVESAQDTLRTAEARESDGASPVQAAMSSLEQATALRKVRSALPNAVGV